MTPRPWLLFLPLNHESQRRSGPECPQGSDQGGKHPTLTEPGRLVHTEQHGLLLFLLFLQPASLGSPF